MSEKEKAIHGEITVKASLREVWEAWTTEPGIRSFLAPDCKVELRPDGPYEIYFKPDAPEGLKGGEGLRVMAIQPMQMFSITWNAPPSIPEVRGQRTHVTIRFRTTGKATVVTLHHDGWGTGGQWEKAFAYFNRAWNKVVLPRLKYRFETGPVDWRNPPSFES